MYDDNTHPLLAQVPLTVSPFVSLPTATTLPYTYKSLPSTLPPSSTGPDPQPGQGSTKTKYIVSSSGHAASPDDIIASCKSLQAHLQKQQLDARTKIDQWEQEIKDRDLAEKRRVAPGYLDSDAKLLQPERTETPKSQPQASLLDEPHESPQIETQSRDHAGEELDRAFGGLSTRANG